MASKREGQRHKRLKLISENLFAHMGYSVKREKYGEGEILSYKGKQPDLLLDGEIPVEVGDTSEEKINHYLREGANEVYWIPFPEGNGVESMEIIKFQMEDPTVREDLKRKIKALGVTIREKEERIQELEEKLQQYETLFQGATIQVYPRGKQGGLPPRTGRTTPSRQDVTQLLHAQRERAREMLEDPPDELKPRKYEGKRRYAWRLYTQYPNIDFTQEMIAQMVGRYHPDYERTPSQETISRWVSLVEKRMRR